MASREQHELKQEGALEAAQSRNSQISAEAAEKILIDETKKAGGQAFQFDPDASPEEKAAQARARVPPGFHHQRRPKGVGLVSDIDDGTPEQYDLPAPSKEGAIAAPKGTNGEAKGPGAFLNDDDRWARDRVGWAPRFGTGDPEDDKGETMLDHQTFLEGKLDDKFFGDWYHNTAVIIFACLSSWVVALLGGGLGWMFIIMATCGTYYRTSLRRVRRNFRDDIQREMAKARLETDSESLEWINSFLVKFWPIYEPVLCDTVIMSVDQVLSTSCPAFLDSLRLKTFVLGSKPPRLEHVKTYPKAEDDTVLMDWKFSFTPNDVMDLTARQLKNKINPKVVLEVRIGKAMISKGLDVIVEDFAFSGVMQVKVKLQIPFPHVEKIDVCFLERPEIDYVCKPLGGDSLGFDINFIPGLEGFIKEQIHGNLAPIMYAPNVFPIEIAKMLAGNPVDLAIGVVAITVHGAQELRNPDKFSGKPDPYVSVSLNGKQELARTKTIHESENPKWNETKYIIITNFTEALTLQVYDFNDFRKDKELGVATFALDQLEREDEHESVQLEVMASGRQRGLLSADIRFFPVLGGTKRDDGTEDPPPESNTGIARVTIEQCKDLDGSKSLVGKLNPYAVLLLNGKEVHITGKLKHTNNPIFPNPSKELLITDRRHARIGLIIKDDRDLATDPILGKYQIRVDQMLQLIEKGQEWFQLADTKTGRAKLTLNWKPVALKGSAGSGGYITPIGVMRIHFQNARKLRNVETVGKSDPYARVLLNGIEKGRTVTFRNNLDPDWDEVVYVPVHTPREKVTLEVLDAENLGRDRTLGQAEIALSDFIFNAEDGGYAVHDKRSPVSVGLRMAGKGEARGTLNYSAAFYPTLNVVDSDDEEEEKSEVDTVGKPSLDVPRKSADLQRLSAENQRARSNTTQSRGTIDTTLANGLANGKPQNGEPPTPMSPVLSIAASVKKEPPKVRVEPEDLPKYESGLIVFKLMEGNFAQGHIDGQLEIVMDDMLFPSYVSSKVRSKQFTFGETGDAMVREIDMSRITLRLVEKSDKRGEGDDDHVIAKVVGPTLPTLQAALYKPHELMLRGDDGAVSKVIVQLKYLPVQMRLDPSESINNMGSLRVDVLDAADLPAADRNGYSDPYCKFKLNGHEVFKTKIQKKTLHPAWNEFFEVQVKSRTAAGFKCEVFDWDFGDKADFLGATDINLELLEPFRPQEMTYQLDGKSGAIRLKMLFKPDYVVRSRQGSSTFSGTFAPAGKVVGAPVKGATFVGGGVIKGASFIKRGLTGSSKKTDSFKSINGDAKAPDIVTTSPEGTPQGTPSRAAPLGGDSSPSTPPHTRSRSFGSVIGIGGSTPKSGSGVDTGSAMITIKSASGYPEGSNVRITVNQIGPKKSKEVHETKSIKAPSSDSDSKVDFDESHETFKVSCAADTQFQIKVKDNKMFGSDDLGEALFFVDDQGTGGNDKVIKAGSGTVVLKTAFVSSGDKAETSSLLRPGTAGRDRPGTSSGRDTPDGGAAGADGSQRKGVRRSLLSKREPRNSLVGLPAESG